MPCTSIVSAWSLICLRTVRVTHHWLLSGIACIQRGAKCTYCTPNKETNYSSLKACTSMFPTNNVHVFANWIHRRENSFLSVFHPRCSTNIRTVSQWPVYRDVKYFTHKACTSLYQAEYLHVLAHHRSMAVQVLQRTQFYNCSRQNIATSYSLYYGMLLSFIYLSHWCFRPFTTIFHK